MNTELQIALMEIVGMLNSPRYDDILLHEAGVQLDRALFPLLARIAANGPSSLVDLADQVGRDPSTVSRQISKLEALGLISRQSAKEDQRVRRATITTKGRAVAAALSAARDRLYHRLLEGWAKDDQKQLGRLTRRLADDMRSFGDRSLANLSERQDDPPRRRSTKTIAGRAPNVHS